MAATTLRANCAWCNVLFELDRANYHMALNKKGPGSPFYCCREHYVEQRRSGVTPPFDSNPRQYTKNMELVYTEEQKRLEKEGKIRRRDAERSVNRIIAGHGWGVVNGRVEYVGKEVSKA